MPVQKISIDESEFVFETVMRVRSTEVDFGQHLTIESLSLILAEARARFFYTKEIKAVNSDYQGLVVTDVAINFPSVVLTREELLIEMGISSLTEMKATMHFKVSRMHDGSVVAKASASLCNFDYRNNRMVKMSPQMKQALEQQPFEL